MTDPKLLPMPTHFAHQHDNVKNLVRGYARANVARATEPLEAEIERLRAEVVRWKSNYNEAIELKGRAVAESDQMTRALREELDWMVQQNDGLVNEVREHAARAERMAGALRKIANQGPHWTDIARDALDREKGIDRSK